MGTNMGLPVQWVSTQTRIILESTTPSIAAVISESLERLVQGISSRFGIEMPAAG